MNAAYRELDPAIITQTESVRMLASVMRRPVETVAKDVAKMRSLSRSAPQQDRALTFIERYIIAYGCAPAWKEIAAELDVCLPRAGEIVHRLADAGRIGFVPNRRRNIYIIDQAAL